MTHIKNKPYKKTFLLRWGLNIVGIVISFLWLMTVLIIAKQTL